MDQLWTPWRFEYTSSAKDDEDCVLCRLEAEDLDRENFILLRTHHCYVVLNRYPYTTGHLMIVTLRHVADLSACRREELQELIALSRQAERILKEVYQPDGFNIGVNIGRSAGAGVRGHLHFHVVPRWHGDANFVSVIGQTRVLPEELASTYEKLAPLFVKLSIDN